MAAADVNSPGPQGARGPRADHDWPFLIRDCRELYKALVSARGDREKFNTGKAATRADALEVNLIRRKVGLLWTAVYHRIVWPGISDEEQADVFYQRCIDGENPAENEMWTAILGLWRVFWQEVTPVARQGLGVPVMPDQSLWAFADAISKAEEATKELPTVEATPPPDDIETVTPEEVANIVATTPKSESSGSNFAEHEPHPDHYSREMTRRDVAKLFGITTRALNNRIKAGNIRCKVINRSKIIIDTQQIPKAAGLRD